MRYERKYRIEAWDLPSLMQVVKGHPASFRTLFPDRQVNNIYLDTPDWHFFQENLAGVAERRKYRIRWYGEAMEVAKAPVMEVKLKDGELGEKLLKAMPDFHFDDLPKLPQAIDAIMLDFKKEMVAGHPQLLAGHQGPNSGSKLDIWTSPSEKSGIQHPLVKQSRILHPEVKLRPTLLNTYLRSYLISADGRFRLTVDRAMNFHSFNARNLPHRQAVNDDAIILEIKYEAENDHDYLSWISQRLPFRLGKNSKYVNGLLLVGSL